jgi:hypothetical protein
MKNNNEDSSNITNDKPRGIVHALLIVTGLIGAVLASGAIGARSVSWGVVSLVFCLFFYVMFWRERQFVQHRSFLLAVALVSCMLVVGIIGGVQSNLRGDSVLVRGSDKDNEQKIIDKTATQLSEIAKWVDVLDGDVDNEPVGPSQLNLMREKALASADGFGEFSKNLRIAQAQRLTLDALLKIADAAQERAALEEVFDERRMSLYSGLVNDAAQMVLSARSLLSQAVDSEARGDADGNG